MRLLAIDTAAEACSVGIAADGQPPMLLLGDDRTRACRAADAAWSAEAMDAAGLAFADLERIAVTIGPGSFTGVRVGIAAARGLALVVGCPAVGIGTLAAHAREGAGARGSAPVFAALDARRGEVYGQAFAADGAPLGDAARSASRGRFAAPARRAACCSPGSGAALVAAALGEARRARIVHRDAAADLAALVRLGLAAPRAERRAAAALSPPARRQAAARGRGGAPMIWFLPRAPRLRRRAPRRRGRRARRDPCAGLPASVERRRFRRAGRRPGGLRARCPA